VQRGVLAPWEERPVRERLRRARAPLRRDPRRFSVRPGELQSLVNDTGAPLTGGCRCAGR
jgi:hypothetical protein